MKLPGKVAIVGGGYAGMAAAQALTEQGIRVKVYEAAKVLGGRARRVETRDEMLDNGQHILSGAYSSLLDLMKRVDVPESALLRVPLRLSMPPDFLLHAPRWPAPLHMAAALMAARGLRWSDRISAIRLMKFLRKNGYRLDPRDTVASLLSRCRQTPAVIQYLWQPLAVGALNTPIETASAQVFANVLRDALDADRAASDLILPRLDLSALYPEAASKFVQSRGGEVSTSRRVARIQPVESHVTLTIDGATTDFDAAIVAVGPHQLESLDGTDTLAHVDLSYQAIETVYMKFNSAIRLPEPMLGQARGHVQWFFDRRALFDPGAMDGLIAGVVSAATPGASPGEECVLRELSSRIPGLPDPIWTKVITEKFATFSCTPDQQQIRPSCKTRSARVFLAGDYVQSPYPATLESAARSGIAAAKSVVRLLQQT